MTKSFAKKRHELLDIFVAISAMFVILLSVSYAFSGGAEISQI